MYHTYLSPFSKVVCYSPNMGKIFLLKHPMRFVRYNEALMFVYHLSLAKFILSLFLLTSVWHIQFTAARLLFGKSSTHFLEGQRWWHCHFFAHFRPDVGISITMECQGQQAEICFGLRIDKIWQKCVYTRTGRTWCSVLGGNVNGGPRVLWPAFRHPVSSNSWEPKNSAAGKYACWSFACCRCNLCQAKQKTTKLLWHITESSENNCPD